MKRTPLVRRTPLKSGSGGLKRSTLRSKPRPVEDRVSPALHAAVVRRDGMCFGILARLLYPEMAISWHQCADRFGNQHGAASLEYLTVDHFHLHAGGTKGDRAPSDPAHLVAMCGMLNGRGPSATLREAERRYSNALYGKETP